MHFHSYLNAARASKGLYWPQGQEIMSCNGLNHPARMNSHAGQQYILIKWVSLIPVDVVVNIWDCMIACCRAIVAVRSVSPMAESTSCRSSELAALSSPTAAKHNQSVADAFSNCLSATLCSTAFCIYYFHYFLVFFTSYWALDYVGYSLVWVHIKFSHTIPKHKKTERRSTISHFGLQFTFLSC